MSPNYMRSFSEGCLRPPTVIGQFHTLFFGSVRMFFLGVLGFAVYGNEALHFSCDPDKREVNLFCYNQFRPITPQVFWALQLVIVLVPGAFFHLYAACKSIKQEDILQKSLYSVFYIFSVLLRIILEAVAFWLQIQLFGFKVNAIYICDVGALEKKFNITRCMVPEHFEKTIFLIAMYTFTVITVVLCIAEIFEISCRRLGFFKNHCLIFTERALKTIPSLRVCSQFCLQPAIMPVSVFTYQRAIIVPSTISSETEAESESDAAVFTSKREEPSTRLPRDRAGTGVRTHSAPAPPAQQGALLPASPPPVETRPPRMRLGAPRRKRKRKRPAPGR
ncbi:putative gap junction epsilon-1 protein [Heliangelus exortis]|uniref:putative gap junction epsilon-1 protein n=1 Tax=Heliangelus exortis TaxID=472823 RepID=UPI003A8EBCB0